MHSRPRPGQVPGAASSVDPGDDWTGSAVEAALDAVVTIDRGGTDPALWSLFVREPVAATQMSALLASAEELAQMGGREMDLDTQRARWTDGMYRIHGLAPQSVEPGIDAGAHSWARARSPTASWRCSPWPPRATAARKSPRSSS